MYINNNTFQIVLQEIIQGRISDSAGQKIEVTEQKTTFTEDGFEFKIV